MDFIVIRHVCVCTWALRRLQGCDVQSCELDEMLQEQAETKGLKPQRPWQLLTDRSVRWQLVSIVITSSAMQLCGNDSVRGARWGGQTGRGSCPVGYVRLRCGATGTAWRRQTCCQRADWKFEICQQIVSCLEFITGHIINAYWAASLTATWKCVIAPCFLGSKLQENAD